MASTHKSGRQSGSLAKGHILDSLTFQNGKRSIRYDAFEGEKLANKTNLVAKWVPVKAKAFPEAHAGYGFENNVGDVLASRPSHHVRSVALGQC